MITSTPTLCLDHKSMLGVQIGVDAFNKRNSLVNWYNIIILILNI